MKLTAKIYTLIPVILIIILFPGCEKFLEEPPQGSLTQEEFPLSASDALLATNATYTTLREWAYHSGGYPILDIMSDDARKGSNPNDQKPYVGPYDTFDHSPTQDGLDRWWSSLYQGVKRTNVVIEKVPAIAMDITLQNRYIAEAKFIRGLLYFDLVRAWGDVPLVLTTTPPVKLPRTSADSIYNQIIKDLSDAIEFLPEKSQYSAGDAGRATKGAAKSLLAKVYLFRHNFVDAEALLQEVVNSGQYDLESLFVNANSVAGNNGIESVFEIGALQVEGEENGGNQYSNTQGVRGSPNRGWGFNRPTIDLRESFELGDPRLKGTIIDLGDTLDTEDSIVVILGDGTTPDVTTDESGNIIEVECYNRKVWVPGTSTITQYGHHRRILRYADVLLMYAEALNENGKPDQALTYLNMVRERARQGNNSILPDIITTDPSLLSDAIMLERRHELAMEGHRFYDLVRTGRAPAVLGPLGFVTGKHELLPVPQNEIDISQGTLTQNPNW
jgi:tetratricopeptide (TPR) repeat protein